MEGNGEISQQHSETATVKPLSTRLYEDFAGSPIGASEFLKDQDLHFRDLLVEKTYTRGRKKGKTSHILTDEARDFSRQFFEQTLLPKYGANTTYEQIRDALHNIKDWYASDNPAEKQAFQRITQSILYRARHHANKPEYQQKAQSPEVFHIEGEPEQTQFDLLLVPSKQELYERITGFTLRNFVALQIPKDGGKKIDLQLERFLTKDKKKLSTEGKQYARQVFDTVFFDYILAGYSQREIQQALHTTYDQLAVGDTNENTAFRLLANSLHNHVRNYEPRDENIEQSFHRKGIQIKKIGDRIVIKGSDSRLKEDKLPIIINQALESAGIRIEEQEAQQSQQVLVGEGGDERVLPHQDEKIVSIHEGKSRWKTPIRKVAQAAAVVGIAGSMYAARDKLGSAIDWFTPSGSDRAGQPADIVGGDRVIRIFHQLLRLL